MTRLPAGHAEAAIAAIALPQGRKQLSVDDLEVLALNRSSESC